MIRSILVGSAALASSFLFAATASAETVAGVTGAYAVEMEMDKTLPEQTVYRPADLKAVKGKLPVLAFGNGGCAPVGNLYKAFLGEIVSYGYLAIASGPIGPEPQMPARPPGGQTGAPPAGGPPGAGAPPAGAPRAGGAPGMGNQTKTEEMIKAIDWAFAENARKDSPYYNLIDTKKVVVLGHSCGGLMAIAAAGDPRVTTAVIMNSGIIRANSLPGRDGGTRPVPMYLPATEADLPKLHAPMIYIIGGPTDAAYAGSEDDFKAIKNVPVFNGNLPIGHGGSWREPAGGKMGAVAFDWIKWQLKGDQEAAKTFVGENCGLCVNKEWTVKRANWKN